MTLLTVFYILSSIIDIDAELLINKVPILFRIVEMYCPKNIWIY